ncbi:MAG: hypothetical protein HQL46_02155 [Gammaproteobacteria bacterium]|nr:hypothetical protein [Gammaproteobacteria bacterium]
MTRVIYFIVTATPYRIAINLLLYLAIISASLQLSSYLLDHNPEKVKHYLNQFFPYSVNFSSLSTQLNLAHLSFQIFDVKLKQKNDNEITEVSSVSFDIDIIRSIYTKSLVLKNLQIDKPKLNKKLLSSILSKIEKSPNDQVNFSLGKILHEIPPILLKTSSLKIKGAQITDKNILKKYKLPNFTNINLSIINSNWKHQLYLQAKIQSEKNQTEVPIRIYAELQGALNELKDWTGKFHIQLNKLSYRTLEQLINNFIEKKLFDTDYQIHKAKSELAIWGEFTDSDLNRIAGQVEFNDVVITNYKSSQEMSFEKIATNFSLFSSSSFLKKTKNNNSLRSRQQINLSLIEIKPKNQDTFLIPQFSLQIDHLQKLKKLSAYSTYFNTFGLQSILDFLIPQYSKQFASFNISSDINELFLQAQILPDRIKALNAYLKFEHYQQNHVNAIPTINNLAGEIWLENFQSSNNLQAAIRLNSLDTNFNFTKLFKNSIQLAQLKGLITLQQVDEQWSINLEKIQLSNPSLNLLLDGLILTQKDFTLPYSHIYGQFEQVDLGDASYYLPYSIMDENLYQWLFNAFHEGQVNFGNLLLRGYLTDFPFSQNEGLLDIVFDTQNVTLNYQDGWPKVENINAKVQFTETGFNLNANQAQVFQTKSKNVIVKLDNYILTDVMISSIFDTSIEDGVKFIEQTELMPLAILHQLKMFSPQDIPVNLSLKLKIPTNSKAIETKITAKIKDVSYFPDWLNKEQISKINGHLTLDNDVITDLNLKGIINDELLNIDLIHSNYADNHKLYYLRSNVDTNILEKLTFLPIELSNVWKQLDGKSNVDATLKVNSNEHKWALNLISKLEGVTSNLPYPLQKEKEQKKKIKIDIVNSDSNHKINIQFNQILNWCLFEENQNITQHFYMSLQQQNFSPAKCDAQDEDFSLTGYWFLHNFASWTDIISPFFKGESKIAQVTKINLDLDSLHLAKPNAKKNFWDKKNIVQETQILPYSMLLNGKIKNLFMGNENHGLFSIKSTIVNNKDITEEISIKGSVINGSIQNYIHNQGEKTETTSQLDLSLKDTGRFLKDIELYHNLSSAPMSLKGELIWPGAPWDFKLTNNTGKLSLTMQPGSLENVNPGAAQIIGVLNLNSLKQGFDKRYQEFDQNSFIFDKISGEIVFNKELMSIPKVDISSAIADIQSVGTINLVNLDLDNILTITPKVSSGLTYVGLILGGPTGAAVGWLGNKIFGNQFNKLNQFQYKVNGNVDNPVITEILREYK